MTFLAPLAGIVAGTLGVLGVLVSYFLKLRRRPVRIASTLLWEQVVQDLQVNAPFRMLRASLLLLLQLLVVACIALALARPAIEGDGPSADRVILIVDTSASMSATDGGGGRSRFDVARDRAIERIRKLPRTSRVMVIASAGSAQTVTGFTRDHGAARAALNALEPTDQPGDLTGAMRVVSAFTRASGEGESAELPALYIYTDGADAPLGGLGVPVPADRVRLERVGPEPGAGVDNAGIGAIAARRDFDDPSVVRLFARIVSARAEPSDVSVRLLLDGRSVQAKTVRVPGRSEDGTTGEAPVTFEVRDSDGALALLSIAGEDTLASDNEAGLVLAAPSGARIVVVQPAGTVSDGEEALLDALYAAEPSSVDRLTPGVFEERAQNRGYFAGVDLVVTDGVFPDVEVPVPTITLGRPGEPETVGQRVAYWSRSHPVMRYLSLGDVIASAPADFRLVERDDARTEELASGSSSTLIGAIERAGVRRLVVSFRVGDSNWARDGSFPVFFANAIDWLTLASARDNATSSTTARAATLFDDTLVGGTEVMLEGPDGSSRTGTSESSGRVTFGVLPRAGLYAADLPSGQRTLAVNLVDARESGLRTSDTVLVPSAFNPERAGQTASGTVEVWRWFVLGAFALLAIEWGLYAWKMRL